MPITPPCAFCIEESCGGTHDCDCSSCDKQAECPRVLRPTIRITTRCTQSCIHCCYDCSPESDDFMSMDVAETTRDFLVAHDIVFITIMGGEVFCHPQWREVLAVLLPAVQYCRIVSNGDWAAQEPSFAAFLADYPQVNVSLSRDQWHSNANVDAAAALLEEQGVTYDIGGDDSEEPIVPVGRGDLHYGTYSFMQTFCSNPEKKYNFLIDEEGEVYKCGFGVWGYADVHEYREGGFHARFKECNQKFYGCFIGSCKVCNRSYQQCLRKKASED